MKYRITKYNPIHRNDEGHYKLSEWTSCYDINKSFGNSIFYVQEYILMEQKYISVIQSILDYFECDYFVIRDVENYFEMQEVEEMLNSVGLNISEREKDLLETISEGKVISIESINEIVTLLLRDVLWCKIESLKSKIILDVGYEYYVHIECEKLPEDLICLAKKKGIYIEKISF